MSKFTLGILGFLLFGLIQIQAQTYEVVVYYPTAGFNDVTVAGNGGEQRVGQARLSGQPLPYDGHALLWLGNSATPIDLHPTIGNWMFSEAFDTDGTRQVGYVSRKNGTMTTQNAVIWNGSANDFVTLSTYYSAAVAIGGDQQVGFVSNGLSCSECGPTGGTYAVLWRGTPESAVVLNPPGFSGAGVADTDGVQQVGGGSGNFPMSPYDMRQRALLWSGTRQSFVDLTPDGYRNAFAVAVKNGTQVGRATVIGENTTKVIVWHNTKESFRDLGPGNIFDTNGTTHVGIGTGTNGLAHAFRWDGDSGANFDLHTLLPPGVFRTSYATAINENGDISGWGQTADYRSIGILWRRNNAPNAAPTVLLNNPTFAGGGSFAPSGSIPLTANATDSDGAIVSVNFYVNGEMIGNGNAMGEGRYQAYWTPTTTGLHNIQVIATDNLGATTASRMLRHNVVTLRRR